jgi:Chemotaxis signal transduction protein
MAANGFIELLRIAKRGNKNYVSNENEVNRWSGIAFEMMGQYFVAPLGEVSEVIYPPKYTPVPNTQSWVLGLANIRGRLLSVSDLTQYVSGQSSQFSPTQKVLCIHHNDQYVGLVVDQVLGIQHFNKKSFFLKQLNWIITYKNTVRDFSTSITSNGMCSYSVVCCKIQNL